MWFSFRKNVSLVIELSRDEACILVCAANTLFPKLQVDETVRLPAAEGDSPYQALQAALTTLLNNYRCKQLFINLSSELIAPHLLHVANLLTEEELNESINLELERLYKNPDNFYFDFTVLAAAVPTPDYQNVLLVTASHDILDSILHVLNTLRLTPNLITVNTDKLIHTLTQPANLQQPINLLPWRTLTAQHNKKKFISILVILSVLVILFALLGHRYLTHKIINAQQQLQQLQLVSKTNEQQQILITQNNQKIDALTKQTSELQVLNLHRLRLPQALDLFANKLPNGLYLTALQQHDGVLQIIGHAANHTAITQLVTVLRNTQDFKFAQLQFVKEIPQSEQFEFAIHVSIISLTQEPSNGASLG